MQIKPINKIKRISRGFSLVEIVLVVGLIAIFSLGIYVIYTKVSDSSQAMTEAREINGIIGSTRSLIGGTNYVATIDAQMLANARIIDQARVSGANYTSGTGQTVSFEPVSGTGTTHIKVTYHNTTQNYCTKLSSAFSKDVDLITVAGNVVQNTMPIAAKVQFDVATVAAACASADFVDLSFNFRR